MKNHLIKLALACAFTALFALTANGQSNDSTQSGTARKVLNGTAKTSVIVVGQTAKYTWKATKFTAGKVAKPIVVKAAPATGKFMLKQSGRAVKKSVPIVKKFAVTYLKFRIGL
ncbi:MAG: hypothetical protein HKN33_09825 [Pyrinomonadaceae bacterium]|nr:hypothetical protein [Pyrinomonadaceae bacterium]